MLSSRKPCKAAVWRIRSAMAVPSLSKAGPWDSIHPNTTRCAASWGHRIVMSAVQVLFQTRPDVRPETHVGSPIFDRERKAQKLDVAAVSKIGGGSVLTLESEPGFRQVAARLFEGLNTFGHAPCTDSRDCLRT